MMHGNSEAALSDNGSLDSEGKNNGPRHPSEVGPSRRGSSLVRQTSAASGLFGALKFKSLMHLRLKARQERQVGSLRSTASVQSMSEAVDGGLSDSGTSKYGAISPDVEADEKNKSLAGSQLGGKKDTRPAWIRADMDAIKDIILGNKANVFLVIIPFGLCAEAVGWSPPVVFLLNFIAILPLAQLLGEFTEEVALHTNETIGGLLNATLGNATEVIISIFALRKGLLRVVQVSLLGSVLSNQLLVTGCCFFFGGLYNKEQQFNSKLATIDASLLLMVVLGLTIPAAFSSSMQSACGVPCRVSGIVPLSHATSILLFMLYIALLVFQLKTHRHLMDGEDEHDDVVVFSMLGGAELGRLTEKGTSYENTEEKENVHVEATAMSLKSAILALAIITILIALSSELLVNSIESAAETWGLSEVFIGLILLPIIGNAAEHATAVTVAMKGKMDLALGIALGSSVQIALCVVPVLCLAGWAMDKPLTLDFHIFETVVLIVSVLVVSAAVREGSATWLEGVMLVTSYLIVAIAYYYRKELPAVDRDTLTCVCGDICCAE